MYDVVALGELLVDFIQMAAVPMEIRYLKQIREERHVMCCQCWLV